MRHHNFIGTISVGLMAFLASCKTMSALSSPERLSQRNHDPTIPWFVAYLYDHLSTTRVIKNDDAVYGTCTLIGKEDCSPAFSSKTLNDLGCPDPLSTYQRCPHLPWLKADLVSLLACPAAVPSRHQGAVASVSRPDFLLWTYPRCLYLPADLHKVRPLWPSSQER